MAESKWMTGMREPVLRAVIDYLNLPAGSRGLDAGCGPGQTCMWLAEAVGPGGHVTGLDISPEFLEHGRKIAGEAGLMERISFREGDITDLPFDDDGFDWAWSADCVGYGPGDAAPLLRELRRVVKPGGFVVILAWSSETLLPGHPGLEARLRATSAGLAPFAPGDPPATHFLRALNMFHKLGFTDPRARAFSGSCHAPLPENIRDELGSLFVMRWPDVERELSSTDRAEFRRLCRPDSPDFILHLPDYYAHFTYTMFRGRV